MIASLIASAALSSGAVVAGPSADSAQSEPRRQQVAPAEIARLAADRIELPAHPEPRRVTFRMPELNVPLSDNGPRLLLGAFGGRGAGMPKLAHVGIGWNF